MRGVGDDKDITSPYGQINFNDTTKFLQTPAPPSQYPYDKSINNDQAPINYMVAIMEKLETNFLDLIFSHVQGRYSWVERRLNTLHPQLVSKIVI